MQTVRNLCSLAVILFIKGIRSSIPEDSEADSSKYSNFDVCSDSRHTVLDEGWREIGSKTSSKCDQKLREGWYRFVINGKPAQLPTLCIKNKACGTVVPLRLDLQDQQLPAVNRSIRASVCGSYTILQKWDCCVLRQPALVHNCGAFYVYRLSPPDRCDVGYCVISEGNLMKMHAFTAKTGESSLQLPKPTYLPSTTKVEKGCSSNERLCPDGCVPLTQSCPMTLDFNPVHVQRRIVHTFDTLRQKHYFTSKTRKPVQSMTTHVVNEPSKDSIGHNTPPTYRIETIPSSTERPEVSTNINRSVFTTVISAITTTDNEEFPTTNHGHSGQSTAKVDRATLESATGATEGIQDPLNNSAESTVSGGDQKMTESTYFTSPEMSETTTGKPRMKTTSAGPADGHTGVYHHDNQHEQPAGGDTYCGVILAFKFEASYVQMTNFTRFRERLRVLFASLLNIYYVDNHGLYMNGVFSWRIRYHRDIATSYTSAHVHFGRGIHNQSYYYITLFAEDIFNTVLYLPDRVISTLLHNSTVVNYIQQEIRDFHVTFVNTTTNNTEVTSTEIPSPTPLLFANLGLCMAVVVLISICLVCALIAVLKVKSKNRCMKLRRKSGQYYVKWEQALKRDVCKGIEYIENPIKDKEITKSDIAVKQTLISSKDTDTTEEEDNLANDLRGKETADDSFWTVTSVGYHESDLVQGLQTKL